MKIIKKISAVFLALALTVSCFSIVSYAADGSVTFSDPDTEVGEMVEVKCVVRSSAGNLGNVELVLDYDSASLRFDSGSDGVSQDGEGSLICTDSGGSSESSFTMTFQALAEGSAKVTISGMTVSSGSGDSLSLTEGDSTVTIGPGDPSKIVQPTAPSAEDTQVEVNGEIYSLTDNFSDADIPSGYTRTTMSLDGRDRQMVVNESGSIYLGYLLDAAGIGDFYMYNSENATFVPYEEISISDTTSIIVLSDTSKVNLPKSYQQGELTLNDKKFPVWHDADNEGYYILYAMNNSGETGYYQYDSVENTYQRFEAPSEKDTEEIEGGLIGKLRSFFDKHLQLIVLVGGLGGLFVLILLIVLAVKLRNRNLELDDLYDEYGIDDEEDEPDLDRPAVKERSPKFGGRKKAKADFDDDDFDDDDFDDDFELDEFSDDDFDDDGFDDDDFDDDDFEELSFRRGKSGKTVKAGKTVKNSAKVNAKKGTRSSGSNGAKKAASKKPARSRQEDDIFSDRKLKRYDTKSYRDSVPAGAVEDSDDLSELMNDLSENRHGHEERDDAFKVDFVDLD